MGGAVDRVGAVNLWSFHLGVDLGQRVDYAAVAVVERIRLGTGFREVVAEVERLTHSPQLAGDLVTTAVDATGMGIVVTEDLQRSRLKGNCIRW